MLGIVSKPTPQDFGNPSIQGDSFSILELLPGILLIFVFSGIVLAFQPHGLHQFLLPKSLVLLVGSVSLFVFQALSRHTARENSADLPLMLLVFLFITWTICAPFSTAINPILHVEGSTEVLLSGILFLSASRIRRMGFFPEESLGAFLAAPALIVAVLACLQGIGWDPLHMMMGLSSSRPGRWRILTTLGNPSWTAEILLLCLPLVMLLPLKAPRHVSPAYLSVILLSAGIFFTKSRAALLGLVLCLGLSYFYGLLPDFLRKTRISFAYFLPVFLLLFLFFGGNLHRISNTGSLGARTGLWRAGIHQISEHPLAGSGLLHTRLFLPEALETVVQSTDESHRSHLPGTLVDRLDQDYLQLGAEAGIPALFLLLIIILRALYLLRIGSASGNRLDSALLVSLLIFVLLSLISSPLHTPATAAFFWILLGLGTTRKGEPWDQTHENLSIFPSNFRRIILPITGAFLVGLLLFVGLAFPALRINATAGRAHRLILAGRPSQALIVGRDLPSIAPWFGSALIDRARALVELQRPAEALLVLEDAEKWLSSEWIWVNRIRALNQLGLPEQARKVRERSLRILPNSDLLTRVGGDKEIDGRRKACFPEAD